MPRGGRRAGAGRPPHYPGVNGAGAAIGAKKLNPLFVMEAAMLAHYEAGELSAAAAIAASLAPFCHPKLSSVTMTAHVGVALDVVEEIAVVPFRAPETPPNNGAAAPGAA